MPRAAQTHPMLLVVSTRRLALLGIAAAMSLSLAILVASPVQAATFTVNSTTDAVDVNPGDGICATAAEACTLRAAIQEANALAGADTITVPAGTYVLSIAGTGENASATGDLDVVSDVTINGAGASSTIIDGGALDRVFHLSPGANTVAISGLTIRNGSAAADSGGGLAASAGTSAVSATVTLTGVAVTGNATTGAGVGGGILNGSWSWMTVTNSTISGNTSGAGGGGIWSSSFSRLDMTNSTVSGNVAATQGGGLRGGTFTAADTFSFLNVTITNNSAATGGGVYFDNASLAASIKNSIVANQLLGANCASSAEIPQLTSAGNNLSSDASCAFGASGDLNSTNPQLGPLAGNGGQTQTHALLAGSPAIDAANNTGCPATDQRAVARPQDGDINGTAVCDIGAYELVPDPPTASLGDVTVTEGDSGFVNAVFTVTLSRASSGSVTMSFATANGTATAPADYESASGTVTFVAGDTSETITVRVAGDTIDEPNETFVVNLSSPSGATLADAQGTGTILDDEGPIVTPAPTPTPTPAPTPAAGQLPDTGISDGAPGSGLAAWLALMVAAVSASVLIVSRRRAIRAR